MSLAGRWTSWASVSLPYLSRRHVRISQDNDLVLVEDLGSSNGTLLRIRRPIVIEPGEDHHLIADPDDPCINLWLHAGPRPHWELYS